jgi:hypothetical protein
MMVIEASMLNQDSLHRVRGVLAMLLVTKAYLKDLRLSFITYWAISPEMF